MSEPNGPTGGHSVRPTHLLDTDNGCSKGRGNTSGSYLPGVVSNTARTEHQLKPFEGFASGEIQPRDVGALVSAGKAVKQLAKPPSWVPSDAPCVVAANVKWTPQMKESHWVGKQIGDKRAAAMCQGCDALAECLASALIEEKGLRPELRFMVRGGLTPKGRWKLDGGRRS